MKKIASMILCTILIIVISFCTEKGSDNNGTQDNREKIEKKQKVEITNIADVKLRNLTKQDKRINTTLISFQSDKQCYFIDKSYNIYAFDEKNIEIKKQISEASVIEKLIKKDESIISFIYYQHEHLLDIKTLVKSTNKVNAYLIDTKTNTPINFELDKEDERKLIVEFIGTYDNGSKSIILSRENEETYSGLYLADTKTQDIKLIKKDITILGYSVSEDRSILLFYGTTKGKIDSELYDFTSPGNFFLYYGDSDALKQDTSLYLFDLSSEKIRKLANSESYYYTTLRDNCLWIEDSEGEFIKADSSSGKVIGDIEDSIYRIMDRYGEKHTTKLSKSYTMLGVPFALPKRERLYYLQRNSDKEHKDTVKETLLLEINTNIADIVVIDDSKSIFSYLDENNNEIVYLMEF